MSFDRRQFMATATAAGLPQLSAGADTAGAGGVPFRLGLVTYNLAAQWDLPTLLRVCRATGISPVELRTTHGHGVEPGLSTARRREVRQRFADSGVDFWGYGTTCEFHAPEADVVRKNVESCKRFISLVADLKGRGVKVRPNGLPPGVPVGRTLDQMARALTACGRAAADAGIEIWLEVHGPGTSHPPHMATVMKACGVPNVGLTWNSNGTDVKDGSVREYFGLLRPWIRSCHINELYKNAAGVYPYRELFRLLRDTRYDRVTLIEVGRAVPDPALGEEMLRYYKALWQELVRG